MAEDRNSTSDEGVDHGVLEEVSTSTTAIDLGATAQVNVILPVGYRDEDRDDDVIADELSADEIARREREADQGLNGLGDDDPDDAATTSEDADPAPDARADASDAAPEVEAEADADDDEGADEDADLGAEGGARGESAGPVDGDPGFDTDAAAAGGADADTDPATDEDAADDDARAHSAPSDETVPDETALGETVLDETVLDETVSDAVALDESALNEPDSNEKVSEESVPDGSGSDDSAPDDETDDDASRRDASSGSVSAESAGGRESDTEAESDADDAVAEPDDSRASADESLEPDAVDNGDPDSDANDVLDSGAVDSGAVGSGAVDIGIVDGDIVDSAAADIAGANSDEPNGDGPEDDELENDSAEPNGDGPENDEPENDSAVEPDAESDPADSGIVDSGSTDSDSDGTQGDRTEGDDPDGDDVRREAGATATDADVDDEDERSGRINELVATSAHTVSLDSAASDPGVALLREAATTKEPPMTQDPRPTSAGSEQAVGGSARPERPSFIKSQTRETDAAASPADAGSIDDRLLASGAIRRPVPVDPWRRIIHSITGGLINLGNGKATRQREAVKARIAAPISGDARFIPVMSRKGGVGKTTVTALLGMALADARDDRVVAVDANPDRGTLAERIAKPSGKTVRDLVRDSDRIRGYGDMSAHVTRDETRLDVLASDADPHVADAFSDEDYRAVADIAQHYYSLVLTDTGTGIVHSVMSATLDLADQLVVVSGVSIDEARLASETLTWLEANGRAELARNAIVVINQEAAGKTSVRIDEVESHFRNRVREVVRIPFDPAIATGSAIAFHALAQPTRDAARTLAALVVEGIRA